MTDTEELARAIAKARYLDWGAMSGNYEGRALQLGFKRDAQAILPILHRRIASTQALEARVKALEGALRDPTKEMIAAGIEAASDCMDSDYDSNADGDRFEYTYLRSDAAKIIWDAMARKALEGEG